MDFIEDDLVSVIIPTCNRKNTIKRSIDSVLNQSYRNLEIILIDDASTDDTVQYVQNFYRDTDGIRIICVQNETNLGPSASRNIGVSHANGAYIAFHDSDDEWSPNKIEAQMFVLQNASQNTGAVYSSFEMWNADGEKQFCHPKDYFSAKDCRGNVFRLLLQVPLIGCITLLIKKEVFLQLGGFCEALRCLEDYEFSLRLAKEYEIGYIEDVLAIAHNTNSGVNSNAESAVEAKCYILKTFEKELEKFNLKEEKFLEAYEYAQENNVLHLFEERM